MNKKVVIGFGTGRCGTKSLARFLNKQEGVDISHEGLPLPFHPCWGQYFDTLAALMLRDSPIVGDVSAGWLFYVDRIITDFPDNFIILLDRRNIGEVVESFYFYLSKHENIKRDNGELWGTYPIEEAYFSKEAIRRSVERYVWQQRVLQGIYPDIRCVLTKELSSKSKQIGLLNKLGIPREKHVLGMERLNKREEMELCQTSKDIRLSPKRKS